MSPDEMAGRVRDAGVKARWRFHREPSFPGAIGSPASISATARGRIPAGAGERLIAAADELLAGRWAVFERRLEDFGADWDWFHDPRTGRRAPDRAYAFGIDHRDEAVVGNVKYVWEISRHHHLTLLAAAYWLSRDERYALRIREHLLSWWRENPFLRGIHWSSGIEIGMRLVAWVWIRRLLEGWDGAQGLFEHNPRFRTQLFDHQRYLTSLKSRGSSANNHRIAELAGLFISYCAFPSSADAEDEPGQTGRALAAEIARQTASDGLNLELATGYHGFVLELLVAAAVEGEATGHSLGAGAWAEIVHMMDALAAIVDCRGRPPRQGDSDDAAGLLLDSPDYDRWSDLLATGDSLFGALEWWPAIDRGSVRSALWTALATVPAAAVPGRPEEKPALFPDAGLAILRADGGSPDEIWCRCDHGPLGFLATAAHGHADALSVELRVGGVDVLADPGTYCYHGELAWRAYFRSTLGHNTLELAGRDQSASGGPFLWLDHARARLIRVEGLQGGRVALWRASHDGYRNLSPPAVHTRTVTLDREARTVTIEDEVAAAGHHPARLAFHLGPEVSARLSGHRADLGWRVDGQEQRARFDLSERLVWTAISGRNHPPLGWYSNGFDARCPTTVLVGSGEVGRSDRLLSRLSL